jgi:hypothetical protein
LETVVARKTVTRENLEGLGMRRLAEILLELGEEDAEIKRRLRLELAGEAGADVVAATLLRRAMIEDTLRGAKFKRYRHAARHILECQALDPSIEDYASFEAHDAFIERIRANHGRKTGFWSRVAERMA